MNRAREFGSKPGSGGMASKGIMRLYQKQRIKELMLHKHDIQNDPYVYKDRKGVISCKLCLTRHPTENSYLVHSQGRKHRLNLKNREIRSKDKAENGTEMKGKDVLPTYFQPTRGIPQVKKRMEDNQLIIQCSFPYGYEPPYYIWKNSHEIESARKPIHQQVVLVCCYPYQPIGILIDQPVDLIAKYEPGSKIYSLLLRKSEPTFI